MNVLLDGASVLPDNWLLIGGILLFLFISQRLTLMVLCHVFQNGLTASDYPLLSTMGWIVPAFLLSLIWFFTGFNRIFWIIAAFLVMFPLLRFKPDIKSTSTSTGHILTLFVFISIILRLAYVSKALFPLYFDSAQHYQIINNIMEPDAKRVFDWLTVNYYHLGFHFLTGFLACTFHAEIMQTMLILGQVILAVVPLSLFILVKQETKSDMAGCFVVILSAFGWYMPAHAVDWGKYPALMSLGVIPFVLSLAYLFSELKHGISTGKRWMFYALFGISLLISVLAHSRTLIVFGFAVFAWITGMGWLKLPQRWKFITFILAIFVILLEVVLIQRQNILSLLFDPYLNNGFLITAFVFLLSILGCQEYPRLTIVSIFMTILLLASLFIPVTILPGYRDLTLLDRPYVEMILFLPLSILGGLGLAGLEKKVQRRFPRVRYVGLLAIGIVGINAFFTYDLYPSDCCAIVGNDDVAAMDWMANQLPVDARIGISSTELKVIASDEFEGVVGADAGIWITPLIGRMTFPLPFASAFDQDSMLERLCGLEIGYLFVGEIGQPFDVGRMVSRPEWYRPLLSMPKTRVYQVVGCDV